jgi:hypothetical protein
VKATKGRKSKRNSKDRKQPVPVTKLASKARKAGENEDEQVAAFRTMLSSLFGIGKRSAESGNESSDESQSEATLNFNDDASIDAPDEAIEPAWAKSVAPKGPEVDRSSLRDEPLLTAAEIDARRDKSREVARRMAMTSLRDVANQSARNALAEHTQRKLRRKMWVDGTLASISLGMGGAYLTQELQTGTSWRTYGWAAVMIGVIAMIEMLRTFIRWQRAAAMRRTHAEARHSREAHSFEQKYDRYMKQRDNVMSSGFSQHNHDS